MKKILNCFIVVFVLLLGITFFGCKPKDEGPKHTYSSYFHKEVCEECGETGTKESERLYDNVVLYTYTDKDYQKFQEKYEAVVNAINVAGTYDAAKDVFVKDSDAYKAEAKFEEDYYDAFDDACEEIVAQYQYAKIRWI